MNTPAEDTPAVAGPPVATMTVPARVWCVVQLAQDDSDHDRPHLGFPTAQEAETHRAAVSAATGLVHVVRDIAFTCVAPAPVVWHHLAADVTLAGDRVWTTLVARTSFAGADDAVAGPSTRWRVITRDAPSQPPSRVRVEVTGPTPAWCVDEAETAWLRASDSPEFATAEQLEAMFASNRP